ncbi:hypothetical protein LWI29_014449 [Acer saccharum]|uniref:ABC-type xenobiotic transporter n=1 Tax=Acer saccharum TaxID=4024 RepID=A0AA39SCC3_ACESA|nr:hypothetical protein LWI29_014449 [Acer saccharum]
MSSEISWDACSSSRATLRNIDLMVKPGEKVAICGEVGSGKSTLLAAILGEVPNINGTVSVFGKIAYVSQTAWIQTGTIQENILFGSTMDATRYQKALTKSCLVKDLEMLPYGDLTEIGERGVNLSGGQKQRVQLARALYQDADVYLLDDPFSAVDAHTATALFNEYVMGALSGKTVLLVTHQVDFLPAFDMILLMAGGKILDAATYDKLLDSTPEFQDLVDANKKTAGFERHFEFDSSTRPPTSEGEIKETNVSSDMSIIDTELAFELSKAVGSDLNAYSCLLLLGILAWPVLIVIIPMICFSVLLQSFRAGNGFFSKHLKLIDANACPYFHSSSTDEWLVQRLEILCAIVLSSSALAMTLLPLGPSASGFIGMALSYGLSLNIFLISSVQYHCLAANFIVSVERLEQYMHIPEEAKTIAEGRKPADNWPATGKVEIKNLKVRYQLDAPLVLRGISCVIEGGHKVGIVGRTGSGKTTLISALFRLVEPTEGEIIIDDINITSIGLHDLRSHLGIIPQDPTLFSGTVRYNLDPLSQYTDHEIWEWKAILVSGFFALIKVLTLSTGPLFLRAFIEVASGKESVKYGAYALTGGLFLVKCLESLSERQWYFRTRLIGLQIRSLLSATIYQKQLRLSNDAKMTYSPGEIVSYVTVDAHKIGELPYWFHQIWTTTLQLCVALAVVYYSVGLATTAALITVISTVVASSPMSKLQHKYQKKLMVAQDRRLKAITEALTNMKALKLYAWEIHFKNVIEGLRKEEFKWIFRVLSQKGYYLVLFYSSPIVITAVTFWASYFWKVPLNASNVFTFLASMHIAQEQIRWIPEVAGILIEAKVSFSRILKFLEAPELMNTNIRQAHSDKDMDWSIFIRSAEISWDASSSSLKATLRNISLMVKPGEKVAICGEVGSGKSTLLAAILGEVPKIDGTVQVYGKIAYVSQTAWIQTGTIQENILFGSSMEPDRYQEVIEKSCLVKDLKMLPFGDLTEIGERGVNLSGGQKQRVQLARALYRDADVYLLDDPFSAVMRILQPVYLIISRPRQCTQNTAGSERHFDSASITKPVTSEEEIQKTNVEKEIITTPLRDQLIKKEERERGDTGLKPYLQYLRHNKGPLFFSLQAVLHMLFIIGQVIQGYWLAVNIQNSHVSRVKLISIYSGIGCVLPVLMLVRSYTIALLGCRKSESIFSTLLTSIFRAPMSFYDSTPLGRILSRVASDMSIIDIELAFKLSTAVGSNLNVCSCILILGIIAWPVLIVSIPMIYLFIFLQRYYFASAKELMRMNGTTKSSLASHLAESIAGAMTIRAFRQEDGFFSKSLKLIDANACSYFHSSSADEWLIQRLEILCAIVLSSSALAMTLLPLGPSASGFIGMALSYGLSLNLNLINAAKFNCSAADFIVSVERLEQHMHIPSEAQTVVEGKQPARNWPAIGKVEIHNLKVKYRPNAPLVLRGISCIIEGGQKVGIVGRTGSGKTTLISALFRLVEPTEGEIIIDDINITSIGLHDLRSHLAIIPQDPTLFSGSVRYNLDPLSQYTDHEIWERSRILVLDEATASIDNATDSIIQKTIRREFADCTVITVAHRIPTVMDCNAVLAISDDLRSLRHNMEDGFWMAFCNKSECSNETACSSGFSSIADPYSCINHASIICIDILLLSICLFFFIYKLSTRKTIAPLESQKLPLKLIYSIIYNGILGLAYFGLGILIVSKKVHEDHSVLPLHKWLVLLFQGFTWLLLALTISLNKLHLPHSRTVKFCFIIIIYVGFVCISSLRKAILENIVSIKMILDILSFPGTILLLFCAFQGHGHADTDVDNDRDDSQVILQGHGSNNKVTPFAEAGFFSNVSFWWLNPLMKKGKERILEDKDIPQLRLADQARTCYSIFMEQKGSSDSHSLLSVILLCQWKAILVSGFFALIKVLTLSASPLFLREFIKVASGKETIKFEAYVLTGGLFLAKCLESLSERQWFFRTRLIGLQVRSMLSAAIYQKQLRLSNTAKMTFSPGEIVSYITVDAYKIGEFPYWFHQMWTTCLQLCLALVIIYDSVGLATTAALITVLLTVLASSPLTKLQHKYQIKLMVAQDRRLKAITEALTNMKVLKLYAWETHFKNVIEGLRKEEFKWIYKVLTQKGYYVVLFWSSPILVPIVTLWACYFLKITLDASKAFTFLASLQIAQGQIRLIPEVAGIFIESKVSFSRIVKFLEARELENTNIRQVKSDRDMDMDWSIFIRSADISWDACSSSMATLRNINLKIKPG